MLRGGPIKSFKTLLEDKCSFCGADKMITKKLIKSETGICICSSSVDKCGELVQKRKR